MQDIVIQEMNEERFNRKHIDVKIRLDIENSTFMQAKLKEGVIRVQDYIDLPPTAVPTELRKSGVSRLIDLRGG